MPSSSTPAPPSSPTTPSSKSSVVRGCGHLHASRASPRPTEVRRTRQARVWRDACQHTWLVRERRV
eukprot:scaffold50970_cov74-Phaeocystis_antarctica.AAC.1